MEKPLYVQVAEVLGRRCEPCSGTGGCSDWSEVPSTDWNGECQNIHVPRYDTDWSATGPLIERVGVSVEVADGEWIALVAPFAAAGPTPCVAVCKLIIALGEAGMLP